MLPCTAIVAGCVVLTAERCAVFASPVRLWTDVVAKRPGDVAVRNALDVLHHADLLVRLFLTSQIVSRYQSTARAIRLGFFGTLT